MIPIQVKFEGNEIVRWVARPLITRLDPDGNRRRKLISMARECASRLKIADWDVVLWDPQFLSLGMIEVLASSNECATSAGAMKVACQIAQFPSSNNPVVKYLRKKWYALHPKFRWDLEVGHFETWIDPRASLLEILCLPDMLDEGDIAALRNLSRNFALYPGHTLAPIVWNTKSEVSGCSTHRRSPFHPIKWSHSVMLKYKQKWKAVLLQLEDLLDLSVSSELNSDTCKEAPAAWLDMLCTTEIIFESGITFSWTQSFSRSPHNLFFEIMIHVISREYVGFLHQLLTSQSRVSKDTNFLRLRKKHLFNKLQDDESAWDVFEASLPQRSTQHFFTQLVQPSDLDLFQVLTRTLEVEERSVFNLQVSIADQLTGVSQAHRNSFLRNISRAHVRLLVCGQDCALIIPYLNKIVLQLNDERWIRDYDLEALQPCKGVFNQGAVRRAANILLALHYPKEGDPFVDERGYQILLQYARRGELYSKNLREFLLPVMNLKDRVCIMALTATARQVFHHERTIAAFVRELIHDRVLMKSEFGVGRMEYKGKPFENDAYYDKLYLSRPYAAANNIRWGSGVPIYGIRLESDSMSTGDMGQEAMYGFTIEGYDNIIVWYPRSSESSSDIDTPSAMIETNENVENVESIILGPSFRLDPNGRRDRMYFGNMKVGRYCHFRPRPTQFNNRILCK